MLHRYSFQIDETFQSTFHQAWDYLSKLKLKSIPVSKKGPDIPVVRVLAMHGWLQYIPRNMHTVFALLCFVVVIHWLIFPYPSGLLHWHCGNQTIVPMPAKQPWWIWINTSCEFIMNDYITTTKQSTTKPCVHISWDILNVDVLWCDLKKTSN